MYRAAQPPKRCRDGQTFFIPGEHMSFELSLRGVIGGEAITAVGEPGDIDGRSVVIVRSRIESAGVIALFKEVRDDVVTWIDVDTGRPIKYYADVKFGKKESIIQTTFNDGEPGTFEIDYERRGKPRTKYRQKMPAQEGAFDVQSPWEPCGPGAAKREDKRPSTFSPASVCGRTRSDSADAKRFAPLWDATRLCGSTA